MKRRPFTFSLLDPNTAPPCTHRYIIVYVCFYHQYSGLCPDDEENTLMRKKTCLLMAAAACLQQTRTEGMMGVIKVRLHWRTTGIELLSKDLCLWLWNSTPYYHKDLQLSALRWYSICLILVSQFSFFWSFCMPVWHKTTILSQVEYRKC